MQGAHHVSHAEGDPVQESTWLFLPQQPFVTQPMGTELDRETFEVMWAMSAPGGEAEGCFLRVSQTDYFYDGRDVHLDWMPDVSSFIVVNTLAVSPYMVLSAQASSCGCLDPWCRDRHLIHHVDNRHPSLLQLPSLALSISRWLHRPRRYSAHQPDCRRWAKCLHARPPRKGTRRCNRGLCRSWSAHTGRH